jgi:hypothetical protein
MVLCLYIKGGIPTQTTTKISRVFVIITIFKIVVHIPPILKVEAQPYDSDLSRALSATISSEWGLIK